LTSTEKIRGEKKGGGESGRGKGGGGQDWVLMGDILWGRDGGGAENTCGRDEIIVEYGKRRGESRGKKSG